MTQSPEYPDLTWVEPKSWTDANRTSVQLIVIHDTEGSSNAESAEDGAAYDARRTDGTSTHYFVDNTSIVQCVRTADQAHAARAQGNKRGIQYELCARASFTKAQWTSADYGLPMLERAAAQVARDCAKWQIPVRRLTSDQVAAGQKGICGHADITAAFPKDNGTHTDPGKSFPWDDFIALVKSASAGNLEDDVTPEDIKSIAKAVWAFDPGKDADGNIWPGISDSTYPPSDSSNGTVAPGTALSSLLARQKGYGDADRTASANLLSAVQSASGIPPAVLAAALVPPLTAAILAGLPAGDLSEEDVRNAVRDVLRTGVEDDENGS